MVIHHNHLSPAVYIFCEHGTNFAQKYCSIHCLNYSLMLLHVQWQMLSRVFMLWSPVQQIVPIWYCMSPYYKHSVVQSIQNVLLKRYRNLHANGPKIELKHYISTTTVQNFILSFFYNQTHCIRALMHWMLYLARLYYIDYTDFSNNKFTHFIIIRVDYEHSQVAAVRLPLVSQLYSIRV